ncbi:Mitochondrial transcription termination factor family protein [Thalictrum thalictroides]|uniref:Mitochondrial transcription termination factor family protein n=1 Tax=Thalictrum thalictroides TaxID=46969 RepID=A0A7J6URE2_THATH|nr:Mitochondrial transcription termination factor family protein [Thalictrum thalictroides]
MVLQFVCRNNIFVRRLGSVLDSSTTTTLFTSNHPHQLDLLRFISNTPELDGFTLDYFKNKCGLSPESALKASKCLVLKSTTKPDLVISLLKSNGFTDAHISKLIAIRPQLLLIYTALKPKFDFFNSIGFSGPDLGNFLVKDSTILSSSLEKRIIPSINYLRSLVDTDDCVARILKRSRWGIHDAEGLMGPNIAILQNHGVPKSIIRMLLLKQPKDLCYGSDHFKKVVLEVEEMGVSPSSVQFIDALHVLLSMTKSTWEGKLAVFRNFGWSEDEVLSMFKKKPFVMANSANKIKLALDFFKHSLKWNRDDISRNPVLISLSLEKRIIPRFYVLQTLFSKDLINERGVSALKKPEIVFLENYVTKYNQEIPDLLKVYQSKLGSQRISVGLNSEFGVKMGKI